MARRPRLAVTLGDPRGIGPEVVEKALALGPLDADITLLGSGERGVGPEVAGRITFDDVLLEPRYSDVVPVDCDVSTRLTRRIDLLHGRQEGCPRFVRQRGREKNLASAQPPLNRKTRPALSRWATRI